jgi:predicted ArsR family transcriptional regulator
MSVVDRNMSGRKPRVTDEEILDVFQSTDDPVLSTSEVAEPLPIERRGVFNRLQHLEEKDTLKSKEIGSRNRIWWIHEE